MKARPALLLALTLVSISACGGSGGNAGGETTAAVEVQSGFADIPGGQLYYEMTGSGESVVLIHGNAGDRRHWDFQFEALARDYRVIRYDVRGFGRSSLPVEHEAYSAHEDLAVLLDHLGVKSAHIGGWSMGSGIAIDFVLAYPERAKSLISVGPWVFGYSSQAARSLFADVRAVSTALAEGG
jgi:pimeloyl-ACP methyl ester carboxylesterase